MFELIKSFISKITSLFKGSGRDKEEENKTPPLPPPHTEERETNLNLPKVRQMFAFEEGRSNEEYKDHLGYSTIGIGHLTDKRKGGSLPNWAQKELDAYGRLSDASVDKLFEEDLAFYDSELRRRIPWVNDLDEVRYAVLLDMAFQMGVDGLLGFKNTLAMIRNGDYSKASEGMKNSLWYSQTPNRADRRRAQMLTGKWGKIS